MAITTYTDLVAAITEYLARDGDTTLIARIPDFILLTEAKFNRDLRSNQMEKRVTTTVNTSSSEPEFITLPSDFQIMRRVRLSSVTGKPRLNFMSGAQADEFRSGIANAAMQPQFFTIFGNEMELIPTPDSGYTIEMVYRANIAALSANAAQNWLLTLAPDLYLYGALTESAPYNQDDERLAVWAALFKSALASVNKLSQDQTYDAGPMSIRVSGYAP